MGTTGMRSHRFHPWRRLRDLGPEWKLRWSSDLPADTYGQTDHEARTITIRRGLSFEERRCTATHEVPHALRGPTSCHGTVTEELLVDRASSRLLLPSIRDLADAMLYNAGDYEATAEDLWVDPWMLEVRLGTLHGLEQAYLRRRLADVMLSA